MKAKVIIVIGVSIIAYGSVSLNAQNQIDNKGRKQGVWVKKNNKGQVIYKGQFKDDIPVDTFYYYDKNGKLELKNFFTKNGKETYSQFIHSNGRIKAEGRYVNHMKDGVWMYYSTKGTKISEENYKNNLKEGQETKWDIEGKNMIEVTTYKQGMKNGDYYQSLYGEGYYTAEYKEDRLDGNYKEFYPDSTLKVKGQYVKDKKDGTWEINDITGKCIQKLFYKNDDLIGDLLLLNVQQGVKEIEQKDIAMFKQAGKQTQIVLFNSDRINVFNSIGSIVPLTSQEAFVRINEKNEIYVNVAIIEGIDIDGSLKTKIDFGYKIFPDKEGTHLLQSMFRTGFDK